MKNENFFMMYDGANYLLSEEIMIFRNTLLKIKECNPDVIISARYMRYVFSGLGISYAGETFSLEKAVFQTINELSLPFAFQKPTGVVTKLFNMIPPKVHSNDVSDRIYEKLKNVYHEKNMKLSFCIRDMVTTRNVI